MQRLKRLIRGILIALTFLTRIPVPAPQDVSREEFTRSQRYYPLIGLLIGLILWGIGKLAFNHYPNLVTGAILLAAEIVLSGGIHLDGFMDTMDGLLSARSPERMLEIMKDSRVGAHASISLGIFLILKFTLLASLKESGLIILIILPTLSRWAFQLGFLCFPYARAEGLGKGYRETSAWPLFIAEGMIILALAYWLAGFGALILFIAGTLFALIFTWRVASLLGGLTGDVYGATIELTELIALLAAFPFYH